MCEGRMVVELAVVASRIDGSILDEEECGMTGVVDERSSDIRASPSVACVTLASAVGVADGGLRSGLSCVGGSWVSSASQ